MLELDILITKYEASNGEIFYCRGLTVMEYTNLSMRLGENHLSVSQPSFWTDIAFATVVSWENVYLPPGEDENGVYQPAEELKYSKENLEYIEPNIIAEIGQFVYNKLSMVSPEEVQKIKGYVRFLYYMSPEKQELQDKRIKEFDCKNCLKNGWDTSRNCTNPLRPLLLQQLEDEKEEIKVKEETEEIDHEKAIFDKYSVKKRIKYTSKARFEKKNKENKKKGGKLRLENFSFPECPVSWIRPDLKQIIKVLYDCAKSENNFFDGGVAQQSNRLYTIQGIVKSEANTIERERMDKSNEEMKKKSNKNMPRRRRR